MIGPRQLRSCRRGAVMVTGIFQAIVLVGCIYYMSGIAETMVTRERMQDAADAGAYSKAAMHARGMNFIALLNVTTTAYMALGAAMPALLRVLVSECAAAGSGAELCEGFRHDLWGDVVFEVFAVGNGDVWVCRPGHPPMAHLSDHEAGGALSEPVPLGALLAAWLFYDELVARELVDHSDVDLHARELLPVAPGTIFQLVSF